MRRRVTFLHEEANRVHPSKVRLLNDSFEGPEVLAVREERLIGFLAEFPSEIGKVFELYKAIHIKWVTPLAFDTLDPLGARASPGLHIFYTPADDSIKSSRLCTLVNKFFGPINCWMNESYISLPRDILPYGAHFQYYEPLDELPLMDKAKSSFCSPKLLTCNAFFDDVDTAISFDIWFDRSSGEVKLHFLWPLQLQAIRVNPVPDDMNCEVGLLTYEQTPEYFAFEVGLGGLLSRIGIDKSPALAIFSLPTRHRSYAGSFSSRFLGPTGMHPTLQLQISSRIPPINQTACRLHAHLTLPKAVFADRYQFKDPLFLASKNLTRLRYASDPVDLEAPSYAVQTWGSTALVELAPPDDDQTGPWTAAVPLHLRYLSPAEGGYRQLEVPYPVVFWACQNDPLVEFYASPFDSFNLGYDSLFEPTVSFCHLRAEPLVGDRLMSPIQVPVLRAELAHWVGPVTATVMALGFGWVLWVILSIFLESKGQEMAKSGAAQKVEKGSKQIASEKKKKRKEKQHKGAKEDEQSAIEIKEQKAEKGKQKRKQQREQKGEQKGEQKEEKEIQEQKKKTVENNEVADDKTKGEEKEVEEKPMEKKKR